MTSPEQHAEKQPEYIGKPEGNILNRLGRWFVSRITRAPAISTTILPELIQPEPQGQIKPDVIIIATEPKSQISSDPPAIEPSIPVTTAISTVSEEEQVEIVIPKKTLLMELGKKQEDGTLTTNDLMLGYDELVRIRSAYHGPILHEPYTIPDEVANPPVGTEAHQAQALLNSFLTLARAKISIGEPLSEKERQFLLGELERSCIYIPTNAGGNAIHGLFNRNEINEINIATVTLERKAEAIMLKNKGERLLKKALVGAASEDPKIRPHVYTNKGQYIDVDSYPEFVPLNLNVPIVFGNERFSFVDAIPLQIDDDSLPGQIKKQQVSQMARSGNIPKASQVVLDRKQGRVIVSETGINRSFFQMYFSDLPRFLPEVNNLPVIEKHNVYDTDDFLTISFAGFEEAIQFFSQPGMSQALERLGFKLNASEYLKLIQALSDKKVA